MLTLILILIFQSKVMPGGNTSVQHTEWEAREYTVKNEWRKIFLQGEKIYLNLKNPTPVIIDIQPWERNSVRTEYIKKIKYAGFNIGELHPGKGVIALNTKKKPRSLFAKTEEGETKSFFHIDSLDPQSNLNAFS